MGNATQGTGPAALSDELHTALSSLNALIDHMYSGILLEDKYQRVTYANSAFCRMFSLENPQAIIGKNTYALAEAIKHTFINPAEFLNRFHALVAARQIVRGEEITLADGRVLERDYIPLYIDNEFFGQLWHFYDVTCHKQTAKELITIRSLLTGVAEANNRLLITTDHNQAISEALAVVGQAAQVDRVYIFQNSLEQTTGKKVTSYKYEWCSPAAHPQLDNPELQKIVYDSLGMSLYDILATGNAWMGRVRDLPKPMRRKLELQGILSLILVPIMIDGEFWGFIGFNDCRQERHWTKNEQAVLATLAAGIGGALKRQQTEKELHKSQALLEVFFTQSMNGCFFMMLDQPVRWDGTVDKEAVLDYVFHHQYMTRVNDALLKQYGAKPEQLLGLAPADIYAADLDAGRALWRQLFDNGRLHIETKGRRFDGSEMWIEGDYICLYDTAGKITGHFGIQRDITDRKHAEEQIKYRAYHDALTGLPNRFLFHDRLSVALAQAGRSESLVALMFLDVDGFKEINDRLGHDVGDFLLQQLAFKLLACVRQGDTVARMGGDEFTIILPGLKDTQAAKTVAERVIDALQQPITVFEHSLIVTTSIGISFYPVDGSDIQVLMKKADRAMYRAKLNGRNNYHIYNPTI